MRFLYWSFVNPIPVFVEVIFPLALVWLAGFLARRFLHLDPQPFSRIGLYLLTPTVTFTSLMSSQISADEGWRIVIVVFALMAALWLLASMQSRLLRLSPEDSSAFVLVSIIINAVNYGFPVTLLAFGETGLERAAIFAGAHSIVSNTLGAYIAARGRASGIGTAARQALRIPMLYAVLLALVLRAAGISFSGTISIAGMAIPLLPSVYRAIQLLAQAAVPIFMLVLGMQLADTEGRKSAAQPSNLATSLASLTRLVISPVIAWSLAQAVGLGLLATRVTVLEAAMPSAVLTVILATEFKAQPHFAARVVVITTLFSMITLTLLLSALR